jgi:hypothetical protein
MGRIGDPMRRTFRGPDASESADQARSSRIRATGANPPADFPRAPDVTAAMQKP